MRKQGVIPAVMYGKGIESVKLSVNERELQAVIVTGARLIDLDMGGKKQMAILKDIQYKTIGNRLVHADFNAVDENTPLHINVDIKLVGEAKGAREGAMIIHDLHEVEVTCLPRDLPGDIQVSVDDLGIGDVLYVKDLPALKNATYRTHADVAVVSCHHAARAVEVAPAAEAVPAAAAAPAAGAKAPAAGAKAPAAAAPAAKAKK